MSQSELSYDYAIVGQGIAGTLIAFELQKRNKSYFVFDEESDSASMVAAGIINPITGRNFVKSWLLDQLLPKAIQTYDELAIFLDIPTYQKINILRTLTSIKDENAWMARKDDQEYENYIEQKTDDSVLDQFINKAEAYGEIKNAYQIKLKEIVLAFRSYLKNSNLYSKIQILEKDVEYHDTMINIKGRKFLKNVIFCNGYKAYDMESFNKIQWNPTKGNVMIIKSDMDLVKNLRDEIYVTPIGDNRFWIGSEYQAYQTSLGIDEDKQTRMKEVLNKLLILPYEIEIQESGIRPATKTRRPVLGKCPGNEKIVVFNGLGTKGASLGPYFADQLVKYLEEGGSIHGEVNILNYFQ